MIDLNNPAIEAWVSAYVAVLVADGRSPGMSRLLASATAAFMARQVGPDASLWPPGSPRPAFETRADDDLPPPQED